MKTTVVSILVLLSLFGFADFTEAQDEDSEPCRFELIINETSDRVSVSLVSTGRQDNQLHGERYCAQTIEELATLVDELGIDFQGIVPTEFQSIRIESESSQWIGFGSVEAVEEKPTTESIEIFLSSVETMIGRYGGRVIFSIDPSTTLVFNLEFEWFGLDSGSGLIGAYYDPDQTRSCPILPAARYAVGTMREGDILTCLSTIEDDPMILISVFAKFDLSGSFPVFFQEVGNNEVWFWIGDHPSRTLSAQIIDIVPEAQEEFSLQERLYGVLDEYLSPWRENYIDYHWVLIFPEGPNGEQYRVDAFLEEYIPPGPGA